MRGIISNQLESQLWKIFGITMAWTIISLFNYLNISLAIQYLECGFEPNVPGLFLSGSILSGIFAGLLGGSSIVFLWEKWLRTRSYASALLYIFLSYTLIYILVSVFSSFYFFREFVDHSPLTIEFWKEVQVTEWQSYLYWLIIVLATLFFLQVNDKYGPGTVLSFLKGKYFHPRKEERIFMFLDLRSSTSIAEKLGEEKYFSFLRDLFVHVTQPILNSRGEIYQYVGDEVVISWPVKRGAKNANCVNCFFRVQWAMNQKAEYYEKTYGVKPEFKAGLHYGDVVAGEIGVVKKDITFSGDVLNTTSRIQGKCNELGVNILLSQLLVHKLNLKTIAFTPKEVGALILRGKQERMTLFTV